jgi:hypothetical protein
VENDEFGGRFLGFQPGTGREMWEGSILPDTQFLNVDPVTGL